MTLVDTQASDPETSPHLERAPRAPTLFWATRALDGVAFQWLGKEVGIFKEKSGSWRSLRGVGVHIQREWKFSLRQRDQDLHVVDGEEASPTVYHALIPVLIYPIGQDDEVTLLKSELAFVLWLKVVEGAAARLVQHLRLCWNRKHPEVMSGSDSCSPVLCPYWGFLGCVSSYIAY